MQFYMIQFRVVFYRQNRQEKRESINVTGDYHTLSDGCFLQFTTQSSVSRKLSEFYLHYYEKITKNLKVRPLVEGIFPLLENYCELWLK